MAAGGGARRSGGGAAVCPGRGRGDAAAAGDDQRGRPRWETRGETGGSWGAMERVENHQVLKGKEWKRMGKSMKIIIFNGKLELDGSEVSSGYVKIASDTMAVVREFSHAKW